MVVYYQPCRSTGRLAAHQRLQTFLRLETANCLGPISWQWDRKLASIAGIPRALSSIVRRKQRPATLAAPLIPFYISSAPNNLGAVTLKALVDCAVGGNCLNSRHVWVAHRRRGGSKLYGAEQATLNAPRANGSHDLACARSCIAASCIAM